MVLGDVEVRQFVVDVEDLDLEVAGGRTSRLTGVTGNDTIRVYPTSLEVEIYTGINIPTSSRCIFPIIRTEYGMPLNSPKRPPYWNYSTSGFDFDHIIAVDMSSCTSLRNFILIVATSGEKK